MLNYIIKMPNRYYQGNGIIKNLRNYTKYLGSSCLVVISSNGYSRFKDTLLTGLKSKDCDLVFHIVDLPESSIPPKELDFVIGVGGGTVIDTAKGIANSRNLPCVIIPTVLSSDACCNSIIVPKSYDDRDTMIVRSNKNPEIVIADTEILVNSPIKYAIAGIGDALSTYHEALHSSETTGYTMTHGDLPDFMIPWAESMYQRLLSVGEDAISCMRNNSVGSSFNKLVPIILYESSILSENCGIGIAHAFSLAYDEVIKDNSIPHGIKVAFGLLLHLHIVKEGKEFRNVISFMTKLNMVNDLTSLGIYDKNKLMKISESISSNKLSLNTLGFKLEPIHIYNSLIKLDCIIKG